MEVPAVEEVDGGTLPGDDTTLEDPCAVDAGVPDELTDCTTVEELCDVKVLEDGAAQDRPCGAAADAVDELTDCDTGVSVGD